MIKIRMALDELLDSNELHFTLTDDKKLSVVGKCGNNFITFYDIELPKNPTNKELDYVKELLKKDIVQINKNLNEIIKLESSKPEKIYLDGYTNNYYLTLDNHRVYINDDDYVVKKYVVEFESKSEINTVIKALDDKVIEYKKYKEYENKISKLRSELQKCNI